MRILTCRDTVENNMGVPHKIFFDNDFVNEAYYVALGTRPLISMDELDKTYQKIIKLFLTCTKEGPKACLFAAHIVEAFKLHDK